MTLIVIARFFFVKVKITLVGSPKKRPAITKKNLAITKIFDFRAVFWHITWLLITGTKLNSGYRHQFQKLSFFIAGIGTLILMTVTGEGSRTSKS